MDRYELKALLMAIMAPNGTSINMNKDMMNKLEQNADEIDRRCFPPVESRVLPPEKVAEAEVPKSMEVKVAS